MCDRKEGGVLERDLLVRERATEGWFENLGNVGRSSCQAWVVHVSYSRTCSVPLTRMFGVTACLRRSFLNESGCELYCYFSVSL